jgi:predicted transcriptional regulator
MMHTPSADDLSRRERQIMMIIYEAGEATASDVMERLPDAPGYSAVRALLRLLVEKGHLFYEQEGPRYVYKPTVPREKARQSALKQVLHTFFGGSTEQAMAALLDLQDTRMSDETLERLSEQIEKARKEGR